MKTAHDSAPTPAATAEPARTGSEDMKKNVRTRRSVLRWLITSAVAVGGGLVPAWFARRSPRSPARTAGTIRIPTRPFDPRALYEPHDLAG